MLNKFIDKFTQRDKKLITYVFGDLLYDEFYDCHVNRLCPETPTPVLRTDSNVPSVVRPGGAGNLANQLHEYSDCTLFCLKDQYQISFPFKIISESTTQNPIKRRFFCDGYMFPRWDIESQQDDISIIEKRKKLYHKLKELPVPDVIFLSDYHKGFFDYDFAQSIIEYANDNKILTIVDPKIDIDMWKGCSVIKLNHQEIENISNTENKKKQISFLKNKLKCNVIVTKQGDGIYGDVNIVNTKKINVKSTSGGGDVFSAFIGLSMALGFTLQESSEIAFDAGLNYVSRNMHNDVLSMKLLKRIANPTQSKIITLNEYKELNLKGTVVFTNGVFDILHIGHLKCLEYAKSLGDILVVGLNDDHSVKKLKGESRPIISEQERAYHLASLNCVSFVIVFNDSPSNLLKEIKPDILVKGGEYNYNDVVGKEYAKSVKLYTMVDHVSTTKVISKIKDLK